MPVTGAAITSALNALRLYSRRVDRAAESIAAAGLVDLTGESDATDTTPTEAPPPAGSESLDLAGAMTSMLIAQRAFVAQLRVLKTADEMLKETVEVVK